MLRNPMRVPRTLAFYARHLATARRSPADASERMIGLMMIRNENDILGETLANLTRFYDRIFVLDGTEPAAELRASREILTSFPEVELILTDAETPGPFPIRDGARQHLLAEIRKRCGTGHWIGVLHGDELYSRDPRPLLARVNPVLTPVVQVPLCHFFLHPSDEPEWDRLAGLPVEERVTHYMWPGTLEDRFFYDTGAMDYDPSRHSLVVPYRFARRRRIESLLLKQYNYRSPEHMEKRAVQRIASGWQTNHYEHIVDRRLYFIESLHVPGYGPCGSDNLKQRDETKLSRPTSILERPLPRLGSEFTPVFVGGVGRTGSTLVKRLLGEHPALVALQWESKFLSFDFGLMDLLAHPTRKKARLFRKKMSDLTPMAYPEHEHGVVDNWGRRAMNGAGRPFDGYRGEVKHISSLLLDHRLSLPDRERAVADFVRWLFDRHAVSAGAEGWVEQTPRNIECAARLLSCFKSAIFVYVYRDPRDVAASLLEQWWGPSTVEEAVPYLLERYAGWARSQEEILRRGWSDRIVTIRFEDLVGSNGESGLGDAVRRLGLEPHPVAIDPERANIGRYERTFTEAQQRSLADGLAEAMAAGGYA